MYPTHKRIESILSLYNYRLPYSVATYFCQLFNPYIVCGTKVKFKTIFEPYLHVRKDVRYVFDKDVLSAKSNAYLFVKLTGIEILIPIEEEYTFMAAHQELHQAGVDAAFIWNNTPDAYGTIKLKDATYDATKYCGKCVIEFPKIQN